MNPKAKYYLMYCRKSSESEDRQMQSVDDQKQVLQKLANERGVKVLKVFQEAKSAKAPGRVAFNDMISLIEERKDIKGLLVWHLNRLSRNPVDTATIQWLLQNGSIKEVITPTKTYTELDSDLIMSLEGGLANRFIRDLRRDTKRGIEAKLDKGQAPIFAPVGYKNNIFKRQGDKDISPHPIYFPLVRKLFDYALTGNYSLVMLVQKARDMGIKNNRGKFISKSQMSRVMCNPFYAGKFEYAGVIYKGKHKPMLTNEEFELLRAILSGRSRPRKVKHDFLTGLIRCGKCSSMITAETHTKHYKNGNSQVFEYYCCTSKGRKKCKQPYISSKKLEEQVVGFLQQIKISDRFVEWAIKWVNEANETNSEARKNQFKALQREFNVVRRKLENLLELKISPENADGSLLSDEEFQQKRSFLLQEKERINDLLEGADKHADDWIDLTAKTFDFASTAQKRFEEGSMIEKKTILRVIGSNLYLNDRELTIQPRKPFVLIQDALASINDKASMFEPAEYPEGMAISDEVGHQFYLWGG